jgi:beta-glucosidase
VSDPTPPTPPTDDSPAGPGTNDSPAGPDPAGIVAGLTFEERVRLLSGADFWHLERLEQHGLGSIMVTDGPHGLRKQGGGDDHLGLHGSVPATCFPPAATLGASWDECRWCSAPAST